jgi:O-antigen ligase
MQISTLKQILLGLTLSFILLFLFLPLPKPTLGLIIILLTLAWAGAFAYEKDYSWADIPMLFILLGTFGYGKALSIIHLETGFVPLYITEISLALALIFLLIKAKSPLSLWQQWQKTLPKDLAIILILYILAATVYLLLGIKSNGARAFRDITFGHYGAFLFFVLSLLSNEKRLKNLPTFMIPGYFLAMIVGLLAYFVYVNPMSGFKKFIVISKTTNLTLYCGLIIVFALSFIPISKKRYKWAFGALAYFSLLFIIVSAIRASWVGILAALILLIIFLKKEMKTTLVLMVLMIASLWAIDVFQLGHSKRKVAVLKEEIKSIGHRSTISMEGANIQFRLNIWKETWEKIKEKPILGWGFGVQIDHVIWGKKLSDITAAGGSNGIMPAHNHLIAITHKMGFVGLLMFLFINARIFFMGFFYVKHCHSELTRRFLIAGLAGLIHWHGMAFFFDILESPPTGIFLWIILGAILAVIHIDKQMSVKEPIENH